MQMRVFYLLVWYDQRDSFDEQGKARARIICSFRKQTIKTFMDFLEVTNHNFDDISTKDLPRGVSVIDMQAARLARVAGANVLPEKLPSVNNNPRYDWSNWDCAVLKAEEEIREEGYPKAREIALWRFVEKSANS